MHTIPKYIVVNYMEPLPTPGSKIWRAHQIARVLHINGHNVEYYTSSFDHFKKTLRKQKNPCFMPYLVRFLFATPYDSNKSPFRVLSNLTFSISLFIRTFQHLNLSTIWIVSYPHSQQIIAICLAKLFNPKIFIIVDLRDSPFLAPTSPLSRVYNIFERYQVNTWISRIDKLIGAGPNILEYLNLNSRHTAQKIFSYIPMACSDINHNICPLPAMASTLPTSSHATAIFFGTLTNSFDLPEVVSLFRHNKKLSLHVAGSGPLTDHLEQLSTALPNIKMHGHVNFNQIQVLSMSTDYSLLCYSYLERNRFKAHFTNKFAESLQLGLTIIIPAWCNVMAEFVIAHKCGYVYNSINELEEILTAGRSFPPANRPHLFDKYMQYFSMSVFQASILDAISST